MKKSHQKLNLLFNFDCAKDYTTLVTSPTWNTKERLNKKTTTNLFIYQMKELSIECEYFKSEL